jgi:hypothetical protein
LAEEVDMRRALPAALAVPLIALAPAIARGGNRVVPLQVCQARYVALGFDLGDHLLSESEGITSAEVFPEEREALGAIRSDLERWGKYVVVDRLQNAEVFLAIRLGRHGSVQGGVIGGGPMAPGGVGGRLAGGGSGSAQVSTASDTLAVYEVGSGRIGTQLWRTMQSGGLMGVPPRAYSEFRAGVEKAGRPSTPLPQAERPQQR